MFRGLEAYDYWGVKEQDQRGRVEQGRQEGYAQGLREGQRQVQEIARRLRDQGFSPEPIRALTDPEQASKNQGTQA